jgi:hypothetical protein
MQEVQNNIRCVWPGSILHVGLGKLIHYPYHNVDISRIILYSFINAATLNNFQSR